MMIFIAYLAFTLLSVAGMMAGAIIVMLLLWAASSRGLFMHWFTGGLLVSLGGVIGGISSAIAMYVHFLSV